MPGIAALLAATSAVLWRRRALAAEADAADWQKIAKNYSWKLDEHGKSWCMYRPAPVPLSYAEEQADVIARTGA